MKKFFLPLFAIALILTAATTIESIFSELEISEEKANQFTLESFGRGLVYGGSGITAKAKALPVEMQVAGTRELIQYAKKYVQTEEFKRKYKTWRNEELGYKEKKKIGNPFKMVDKAIDKQLNRGDDEKRMPADPDELIRKRLQEFLDISATVDFDAELNGYSFADKRYESKSNQWKMCYRAGREVITAAREEAKKWLAELE